MGPDSESRDEIDVPVVSDRTGRSYSYRLQNCKKGVYQLRINYMPACFYQLEDRYHGERIRDTCNPKEMVFGY